MPAMLATPATSATPATPATPAAPAMLATPAMLAMLAMPDPHPHANCLPYKHNPRHTHRNSPGLVPRG